METTDRMVRTTVFFPADLLIRVRGVAMRKGVTSAAIIRAAVESSVGQHRPPPEGGFLRAHEDVVEVQDA